MGAFLKMTYFAARAIRKPERTGSKKGIFRKNTKKMCELKLIPRLIKWWRNEQLSGWNLKRDSWFSFRGWKSYLAHREWNGSQLWQQVWSKFKQHITFTSVTIPSLFLSKAFMKKSDDLSILMKLSLVKFPSSPARRITLCAGLDQNVLGWWSWSKCALIGLGKKTGEQTYTYALVLSLSFAMSSIFRTRITCLSPFYWRQFHVPQRFQSIPTKKWTRSHLCPPLVKLVITNFTIDNIKCDYANALIFRCKSTADLACFKQTDNFFLM